MVKIQIKTIMKKSLLTLIICILSTILLTGCSTTRKSVQSTVEQQVSQSTSTATDTHSEKSEALLTRTDLSENLNAVIDFTRIEFTDGTTLTDIRPPIRNDTAMQRNREETEPPNANKGIKAITTGHIDLNKSKDERTDIASKADSKSDISQTSEDNTTSNLTQKEKSTEKDKRGLIYWLGVILGAFIAYKAFGLICRFIKKKKNTP